MIALTEGRSGCLPIKFCEQASKKFGQKVDIQKKTWQYRLRAKGNRAQTTESSGCSSVVERHLAKVNVARSNRVTRF